MDQSELTQSLSTATRFMMEDSFSTHARAERSPRSPNFSSGGIDHPITRNQNPRHDTATTDRCRTRTENKAYQLVDVLLDQDDLLIETRRTCKRFLVSI
jgi:hypothetical protein